MIQVVSIKRGLGLGLTGFVALTISATSCLSTAVAAPSLEDAVLMTEPPPPLVGIIGADEAFHPIAAPTAPQFRCRYTPAPAVESEGGLSADFETLIPWLGAEDFSVQNSAELQIIGGARHEMFDTLTLESYYSNRETILAQLNGFMNQEPAESDSWIAMRLGAAITALQVELAEFVPEAEGLCDEYVRRTVSEPMEEIFRMCRYWRSTRPTYALFVRSMQAWCELPVAQQ